MKGITVLDVIRELGLEPTSRDNWKIGSRVRLEYLDTYKKEPVKDLRQKTSGAGSHCFAIYPVEFVPKIREIIADFHISKASVLF